MFVFQSGGNFDNTGGWNQPDLGIAADGAIAITHTLSDLEIPHTGADRLDEANTLKTRSKGRGQLVQTRAMIGVDEVYTDYGLVNLDFTRARFTDSDILELENLGSACFVANNGFGHDSDPA